MQLKRYLLAIAMMLFVRLVSASIVLPPLVTDNMVLQRDSKVVVWGWAAPAEQVSVNFHDHTYHATTGANGKWQVLLNAEKAGGPFDMHIDGTSDHLVIHNILMGDVWLCGGQSNMVLDFNNAGVRALYKQEIASSANDQIRQIVITRTYSSFPASSYKASAWKMANPTNLPSFSAAAYFFARNIYEKYHVPIGLINSCLGGTIAEAWTSEEGLKEFPQFAAGIRTLHDTVGLNALVDKAKKDVADWDAKVDKYDKAADKSGIDVDDHNWASMAAPGFWDEKGLPHTYGSVWFRKELTLPADFAGKPLHLKLGKIDDVDVTYFNGVEIGRSANRDIKRDYVVPANLVKQGRNVIAVRIINYNGTGGFFPEDTLTLLGEAGKVSLNGDWKYLQGMQMPVKPAIYEPKNLPTSLYNAMMSPLIPYTLKGIIWYQGEYNTHKAYEYRSLFPALIRDWRKQWNQGDLPFIFVQLPNFQPVVDHPQENEWAELRDAQTKALALPKTAMAVTIDAGGLELHPADKKDVGDRLALAARKMVYGEKKLVASGPVYKSMAVNGNTIVLTFDIGDSPMVAKGSGQLKYFAIAGNDKKFVWANAVIKGNTVIVSSPQVTQPVAVRYAWAGNPDGCNLYNEAGLPASPFRTDTWPGLTDKN